MNSLLRTSLILSLAGISAHAQPSARLVELRKERSDINRQIRKAVPDPSTLDPELKVLERASIDAEKAYQKAIDTHPDLQSLKAETSAANTRLTQAIAAKDEAAKTAAQEEISKIMTRRMEAAAQKPELQPLGEASRKAMSAWQDKRKQVLADHPETKELSARLETLNGEIQAEMKASR